MAHEVPNRLAYNVAKAHEKAKRFKDVGLTSSGQEHVPPSGPVLFVASHRSEIYDVPALGISSPRYLNFIGKHVLDVGFKGWMMEKGGVMFFVRPQDRGAQVNSRKTEAEYPSAREIIPIAAKTLRKGWSVAIFAEGTSHNTGPELGEFQTGVGQLAIETAAMVQTVGIGYDTLEPGEPINRVHVAFGEPFSPGPILDQTSNVREARRYITAEAQRRTQDLFDYANSRASSL